MAVIYVGDDLLSHTLSRAVQSARRGLTSVFGMGTGISPAVRSPATCGVYEASEPRAEIPSAFQRGISTPILSKNCGASRRRG